METSIEESITLDADDLRILQALLIAPRLGFARLAAVLASSEATVARRYRRLVRHGVIRVVGVVDTGVLGQSRWIVRLRCRPGSASAIADALADRDDVSWLGLGAGGSELVCVVRPRSDRQRDDLLGARLPRLAAVLDIQTSALLHRFQGGRSRYWTALRGALTAAEERQLGEIARPFETAPVVAARPLRLDADDRALADALALDGRTSIVDLARATGSTPARVTRRLQLLEESGALYFDVEMSALGLGYRAPANLWLRVEPAALRSVGEALAQLPQIGFTAATTGPQNLLTVAHCRDLHELFEFSSDRLGALPGVRAVEVSPIVSQVKQIVARVAPGGRLEPA